MRNPDTLMPVTLTVTPRELDVIALRVSGLRYWDIAHRLGIGPETVQQHLSRAKEKLSHVRDHQSLAGCCANEPNCSRGLFIEERA